MRPRLRRRAAVGHPPLHQTVCGAHADPETKGLLRIIGRKLHQGDRMPRHDVKTHTRRVVALDYRIRQSESVGTYVQQIHLAALVEPCANWRAVRGGPADGQPHRVANDAAEVPGGRSRLPLSWVPNNSTPQAGRARPVHLPVMPQTTACEPAHRQKSASRRSREPSPDMTQPRWSMRHACSPPRTEPTDDLAAGSPRRLVTTR